MQEQIWTIFHRSGSYDKDYTPLWCRYLCYGGTKERTWAADSTGSHTDCLTLGLDTYHVRLIDAAGQSVTFAEAGIGTGDLLVSGEATEPGRGCYRIQKVTEVTGTGWANGYVLVAE